MYQPKLYLRFEPPIYNDALGINQLNKILGLIKNEYPETTWWEGGSPTSYNPFTDDEEDMPDQVKSLTIGHWSDGPNRLTYGQWDDNDQNYQNAIDGWQWLKEREVDYDQTSDIFSNLNENKSEHQPKVTYRFDPPIESKKTLERVLYILNLKHPGLKWINNQSVLDYDIYNEVFRENSDDVVGSLTIGFFEDTPNDLSWNAWIDPSDTEYGPIIDGWQMLENIPEIDVENIFNQLNESTYQPKLNLKFEPPISEADELDKVLRVLSLMYPDLQWTGGDLVARHNVIRNQENGDENFEYDPIYYLTIGFFPHAADKLTYTNGPYDDPSFAEDEHHHYNSIDGWQWVKNNDVNYDLTTDIFNQLNESYDFLSQTNLKGFIFKKSLQNDRNLWIIRTVINDDGEDLYFEYKLSDKAEELMGEHFPKYGEASKKDVIKFVNDGTWEIVDMPTTTDTEGIFNQID